MTFRSEVSAFGALRGRASKLREAIHASLAWIKAEHPRWVADDDLRWTCFQSLKNIARYTELSLHYLYLHLSSKDFWSGFRPVPSLRDIEFEFAAYSMCLKTAVLHLFLSSAESSHRSFLQALDPDAAKGARGEYQAVYTALLQTKLRARQSDLELLNLLRQIRNTIHNEGVHRHPKGRALTAKYNGVEYSIADGKPLDFVTWHFVLDRVTDLVALQDRVVRHQLLASHSNPIADPIAKVFPTTHA